MKFELTSHASSVKDEPRIKDKWIEETLDNPDFQESGHDNTVHYIKKIEEHDGRFLRVVVNPELNKIITLFFDRRLRRDK